MTNGSNSDDSQLGTVNRLFLILLAMHVPALCAVAFYFGTGVKFAAVLGLLFLSGPALLYRSDPAGKLTAVAMGVSSMCFSALLIHLSGGMTEMHFHIFTMLALTIAFRFPWPLVVAAATIAVHHIAFWFWLPGKVFSEGAGFGIVILHAFFVVFEVVPALWLSNLLGESARTASESQGRLRKLVQNLRGPIGEISGTVHTLVSTSGDLSASSARMTRDSEMASARTRAMAESAARMKAAALAMAGELGQSSARLGSVAHETEKMKATIEEIAQTSQRARLVTGGAAQRAARVTEEMNQLREAVREIGKITETITEISSQTNLLALNATIEAARAGAAGKGFAVVAGEIKALAQQTAGATEDIKRRIGDLRKTAAAGVSEMEELARVADEVSAAVSAITLAIEQQSVVTRNIAKNIADASGGVGDANTNAAQTSQVSAGIAGDVEAVSGISGEMLRGSERVMAGAREVSEVAAQLRSGFSRFQEFCESSGELSA